MLKKDPKERLSASEALSHPWFLVSNEFDNLEKIDLTLFKSTVMNTFHSPIISTDRPINYDDTAGTMVH